MIEVHPLILAVDFDGTICKHAKFPELGDPVPHSIEWLHKFHDAGAKMFMWTCRSGDALELATQFASSHKLHFSGYNAYKYWEGFDVSDKLFANMYIDDAAACVPLVRLADERPYLDWTVVGPAVMDRIKSRRLRP